METKYKAKISLKEEIKKLFDENELAFEMVFPSIGKKLTITNDFRIEDKEIRSKVSALAIAISIEEYVNPGVLPEGIIYCQGNRYLAFSGGTIQ